MRLLCFLYMIVCGGSKYVMFSVCCMYLALASGGYGYGWGDIKSLHLLVSVIPFSQVHKGWIISLDHHFPRLVSQAGFI